MANNEFIKKLFEFMKNRFEEVVRCKHKNGNFVLQLTIIIEKVIFSFLLPWRKGWWGRQP